ncbi:MAG: hypothetical protein KAJ93_02440 [Methanosarcinales archaeon]|nr:hypothetical protein [Methanosarcinales archaeon]
MKAYIKAIEGDTIEMTVIVKIKANGHNSKEFEHLHLGECGLVQGDE